MAPKRRLNSPIEDGPPASLGLRVQPKTGVDSGRVTVAGSMTLGKGGRAGTHQVLVAFVDGDEDVTAAEASDNVSLSGPGSSAPIYALGDALSGHQDVDCVPLQVSRLIGSSKGTGDSKGGS